MSTPAITSPIVPKHWLKQSETLLSFGMLVGLVVMLAPLPQWLLDVLLAANIAATLLLLLVTLATKRAMELAVFPSLLLLLTLYRLSLNVATTRLILLDGDAGHIVTAFGNYVVGGQLVVGLTIFLILVTIQFMVITKGAGRVAEVSARFTLDAMPGKQMAIDAELQSGAITNKEARRRRDELSREAEFYGAMDGASKFVRGDAVAGLIITGVNLVGGVIMGLMNGMSFSQSVRTFSILSVGDGLVTQIPALVIATSAGILVTKTTSDDSLGDEIGGQLFHSPRSIWVGAGILALIAMMPGLPKIPFLGVAGIMLLMASGKKPATAEATTSPDGTDPDAPKTPDDERYLDEFLLTERAIVEVGARLVPFIQSKRIKGLSDRITALRREFSKSNGLWIPPIRVHSNLADLQPEEYRIYIAGRRVGGGEIRTENLLAILPDGRQVTVSGEPTVEPAFGLTARWISQEHKRLAEHQGCTVVDPLSVLITHLGEVLKRFAHELLTREALKQMLDRVREFAPTIVDEIKPETIRMGTLHQVLVQLAEDRISLADITLILESIVNHAPQAKNTDNLIDAVRTDLGRLICERFRQPDGRLRVLTLDRNLHDYMQRNAQPDGTGLDMIALLRLTETVTRAIKDSERKGLPLAVIADQRFRRPLKRLLARISSELGFIATQEIPSELSVESAYLVMLNEIVGDEARDANLSRSAA
jgi:flagellar biosynthesis protein FlhA